MSRRLFDASGAAGADPPAKETVLSVAQLSGMISETLEKRMPARLRVTGEVSNLSARNHWYFSLKDDEAVIGCVAWASAARRFGFVPGDGDAVVATGHVGHYAPQGRTQFYVTGLEPAGEGELERRFRALCDELRGLGWFDEERKRPLPVFPRRIAVITSAGGAALQDVIATARSRCVAVGLTVVDVRVQGAAAAGEIARAVAWVDRHRVRLGVDAILVTRGGGSIEDLWAFNERIVAAAVLACDLPVVAAIGHESDTTVIELVADRRAATPTQAIMHLVPDGEDLRRQVAHHAHRIDVLLRRRIDHERRRLELVTRHELFARPEALIERGRDRIENQGRHLERAALQRVTECRARLESLAARFAQVPAPALLGARRERVAILSDRLDRAIRRRIDQRERLARLEDAAHRAVARAVARTRDRVERLQARLDAVDPRLVLARGYTYTVNARGVMIRRVADVAAGEAIETHVVDGTIRSVVGGSGRRGRNRSGGESTDQAGLFDGS